MTLLERNLSAKQLVDNAIAKGGLVVIPCSGCGEPVGAYIPGRVAQASLEVPKVRLKCMRRDCRTITLASLGEVRRGKFFSE